MDTQQIENLIETEDFVSADEVRPEDRVYPCRTCSEEHDTDHLFCPRLREISKLEAKEQGVRSFWISDTNLELLAQYAECEPCSDPTLVVGRDITTLASAMAECRDDNERHRSGKDSRQRQESSHQLTHYEVEAMVLCVACLARGRVTKIRRGDAMAPGHLGVQIMEAMRRHSLDLITNDLRFIGSEELMRDGLESYAHCPHPRCIEAAVDTLRQKARDMGCEEEFLMAKIQAWSLVGMIVGTRRNEEGRRGQRS